MPTTLMIASSNMVILRYLESLITNPNDAVWVYDVCSEMPVWDEEEQDYVFKKTPKRVDPREAKSLIKEHGLKCVCDNEHGRIYI